MSIPEFAGRFRGWIERGEPGRYRLYVMTGCPWAHRALIARALKGLEDVIPVTTLHHHLPPTGGWRFDPAQPDPLYGATTLRELYERASPGYTGRVTVPVLWDTHEGTLVNNESADIMRILNTAFDAYARYPHVDLYPRPLRAEIDRWNARLHEHVNAGAYAAGFATGQAAHDEAVGRFFAMLGELDTHLAHHRYLVGERPTEADWRLLPALLRFELVYHFLFRINLRRLSDYPNVHAYVRELAQWPGIAGTIDEHAIRHGYWTGFREWNPNGIVPAGPLVDWNAPHGRGRLASPTMRA